MRLLAAGPDRTLSAVAYGYAALATVVPVILLALAWT